MSNHDRDFIEILAMVLTWIIVLTVFLGTKAMGSDGADWFCTERAVVRQDDVYKVCGVSSSPLEPTARLEALANAKREFVSVCDADSGCLGHEVTLTPGRTECSQGLIGYTCRRLLVFRVLETKVKSQLQYHPNYYMYLRSRQ